MTPLELMQYSGYIFIANDIILGSVMRALFAEE